MAKRACAFPMAVLLLAGAAACGAGAGSPEQEVDSVPSRPIEEVHAAHSDSLMALPGIVGTAIGLCDGTPCIHVYLADSSAATRAQVPERLEGYEVQTQVTGMIRPRRSP